MIIDEHYIDNAIRIRKEYLKMTDKLSDCEDRIEVLNNKLLSESKSLEDLSENLNKFNSAEEAQASIFDKLNEVEIHLKKINDIYEPIHEKIEELKDQENLLYETICQKYPNLSNESIVHEINSHLEKI